MDFKSLREQILANVDNYSVEESKIVITKLLDFLIDTNEKRTKLEIENKQLFEEMNLIRDAKNGFTDDCRSKVDDFMTKANNESKKVIDKANIESERIINEANKMGEEIINSSIEKIKDIIKNIKNNDDESKLYRTHILSIFRKTIFKFADTNYYIFRRDDKDFKDLLHFLEVDEKLQKLCNENMKKLQDDPNYQKICQMVNESPELEELADIKNILNNKVLVDDEKIDINKAYEEKKIIEDLDIKEITEIKENDDVVISNKAKSLLDIINKQNKL